MLRCWDCLLSVTFLMTGCAIVQVQLWFCEYMYQNYQRRQFSDPFLYFFYVFDKYCRKCHNICLYICSNGKSQCKTYRNLISTKIIHDSQLFFLLLIPSSALYFSLWLIVQQCAQFLILDFLTHTEVKSFIKKSIDYILYVVPVVKKCMHYDKVWLTYR